MLRVVNLAIHRIKRFKFTFGENYGYWNKKIIVHPQIINSDRCTLSGEFIFDSLKVIMNDLDLVLIRTLSVL